MDDAVPIVLYDSIFWQKTINFRRVVEEGLCAEAVALGAMVTAGGRRAAALLVLGEGPALVTPCGGCRQKLREFAAPDTPVLAADAQGIRQGFTLAQLLPHAFGPEHLGPA